jgi:hypothetical protein
MTQQVSAIILTKAFIYRLRTFVRKNDVTRSEVAVAENSKNCICPHRSPFTLTGTDSIYSEIELWKPSYD